MEQESGPGPAGEYSPESKKLVQISMSLVAERNLQLRAEEHRLEDIKEALAKLMTVRLDRENINTLGNFECMENVCSLYLQQNQIKKIENLELFHNLRFLTLAGNRIQKVENLKCLQKLGFLDLSNNQIEQLDPGEFPERLIILNMSGNGCTKQEEYREQVIQTLPALQQLDGILIQRKEDPIEADEGGDIHDLDGSENEEDSDELYDTESEKKDSLPNIFTSPEKVKDFFAELHNEMVFRSQERRKEVEKDHKTRLNELQEIRNQLARIRCEPIRMNKISNYPKNDPNFGLREAGQNEERAAQTEILD
ncbi:leucine-rich repeat-containing protein 46-like isoform X2 [Pristis pectinata]|uniref:leucine-rich repeat-containing protein 46-like isoform X2 n=1 Tax=Pristis pectinata TaxID=685728 RepID=UPI00223DF02C|nr:leucine-rich repeat-containing protein 46-like isoform X2 [Pristis pectinata]